MKTRIKVGDFSGLRGEPGMLCFDGIGYIFHAGPDAEQALFKVALLSREGMIPDEKVESVTEVLSVLCDAQSPYDATKSRSFAEELSSLVSAGLTSDDIDAMPFSGILASMESAYRLLKKCIADGEIKSYKDCLYFLCCADEHTYWLHLCTEEEYIELHDQFLFNRCFKS